jgi:hypothetical protein
MVKLTKPQQRSLVRKWREDDQGLTFLTFLAFRRTAVPLFGDDCVLVEWCGMWLGIETDGYCHS